MSITLAAAFTAVALCGCQERGAEPAKQTSEPPMPNVPCSHGAYLRGKVIGAVSATLDWETERIDCEGMPRPEGKGARLRFEGKSHDRDRAAAIIIALPELDRGETGMELGSNVTFVVEGSGRFFSSSGPGTCWTDVDRQDPLSGDRYVVAGKLYCIGPLVEVNGDSSVSIPELDFSGMLDWSAN